MERTQHHSSLTLQFDVGLNEKGRTKMKTKTYSAVKYAATDEDLYEVSEAIAGLQEHDLFAIFKHDKAELSL